MTSRKKATGAAPPLRLTGELTIFRAAELKQLILACPPPVEIDLAGVTDIDTAGLQLLLLAKQTAVADKRELRLVAHSAAVTELFELLHVAAHFGDPMVVDAPTRQSANHH